MRRTRTGAECFLRDLPRRFWGAKVAVLCHNASRLPDGTHIVTALKHAGIRISFLFAPEHGIWGTHQDQEPLASHLPRDPIFRIPVVSLYGDSVESLSPDPHHLLDLDAVIVDLQDVGARYYTFVWTVAKLMEVATKTGTPVWILDRPNPINGVTLEGPTVAPGFRSFVGYFPVPVRHGLTIGEIASWLATSFEEFEGLSLKVVPMSGWRRKFLWRHTGLPWLSPSPNMPTPDTALVYPGMCLLEGTNVSEGRGTTRPFEQFGAPWVEPPSLIAKIGNVPGATLLPTLFKPTSNKFSDKVCAGAIWHIQDPSAFPPFLAGLKVLSALLALYPGKFRWRPPPYEFEEKILPIDILLGSSEIREALESGISPDDFVSSWRDNLSRFAEERAPFLMYPKE
ncbi:MAG: exo-beta-N-acetylmuramidase NamZ family protein [bacterium JZ-2024 1]